MVPLKNLDAQKFIIHNFGHPVSKSWLRPWVGGCMLSETGVGCYGGPLHQIKKMSLVTCGAISSQRRLMEVLTRRMIALFRLLS